MERINLVRVGEYFINLDNVAYIKADKDFTTILFPTPDSGGSDLYQHCLVFKADSSESKALLHWLERMQVIPDLIQLLPTE